MRALVHPPAPLQASLVQTLESLQLYAVPLQPPEPLQRSVCVHAFESSHARVLALGGYEQLPSAATHVPALSKHCPGGVLHAIGSAPLHAPFWQVSVCVHSLESSQRV